MGRQSFPVEETMAGRTNEEQGSLASPLLVQPPHAPVSIATSSRSNGEGPSTCQCELGTRVY